MPNVVLVFFVVLATQAQTIHVDANGHPSGNGSSQKPFNNIPAAVALAKTLGGSPNIRLEPGRYEITDTLNIENGVTLQGSNELVIDGQGWPTGVLVDPTEETRIVGMPALADKPLINVGKTGQVIQGVRISGLTLEAAKGDGAILIFKRVQDFEVRDSILIGSTMIPNPKPVGIDAFASSGTIRDNYMSRLQGGAFISAGYAASPADVTFRDNRAVKNLLGIFLVGTSDGIPEQGNQLSVTIRDNDLSDNNAAQANSAGIRLLVKGRETSPGSGPSAGNIRAIIRNNRIVANKTGIVIDAGFVSRLNGSACDSRTFTGSVDLRLQGNTLAGSVERPAVVSFTQLQTTLGKLALASAQYLHNATFQIQDPDNVLAGKTLDHPAADPFVGGPCGVAGGTDQTKEMLGNLLIDGSLVFPTP